MKKSKKPRKDKEKKRKSSPTKKVEEGEID